MNAILRKILFVVLITAGSASVLHAENRITSDRLHDKIRGMFLGQLIANAAGRPTEGVFSGPSPNPAESVPWDIKQIWDGDDDTDFEYLALHILETDGIDPTSARIGLQWLDHVTTSGIYIANRQAYFLLQDGLLPPLTGSRRYNMHWYAIDSQITTESIGAMCPGLPQKAIDLTKRFARVTNDGFQVHASQFYAALYANAFFESDPLALVDKALQTIPTTSRTHQVITDVRNWYIADAADSSLDWRSTRRRLYDHYQGALSFGRYQYWIESTINTGATVLAILYGQGDFEQTAQIGVLAGWDCDCNPATAGGLIGIIDGYSGLPSHLTDPEICGDVYQNNYKPYLPNPQLTVPQLDSISDIASRMAAVAEQIILANGGYITAPHTARRYHIPDQPPVVPDPEMPDPAGPSGLVADAIASGIVVTANASVEAYNPNNDVTNLNQIIDGIKDNSHNGHRPYRTYRPNPADRPEKDYYQLTFDRSVRFTQLTFYEGDIYWYDINGNISSDPSRGGFFEDLRVRIRRGNSFIQPANLTMSEPLRRTKMYQTITFDFTPTAGDAIQIIGAPGGTDRFTTILELQARGSTDPGLFVTKVTIAEEQPQRSNVDEINITFNRSVSLADGALALTGSSGAIDLAGATDYDHAAGTLTLGFAETLPDDIYKLDLIRDKITDANGLALSDEDRNPADGKYTIEFHRLYGDVDGNANVDQTDLAFFADRWLSGPGDTGLDANGDNIINLWDFALFNRNWRRSLP